MPTYEYACDACGHKFESFHSITAPPIKVCPVCKKKKVKRLVSGGAGFIFKGSGFYITDYRSDSYKADAKGDSDSAASPAAPKSDTAAAKTDGAPAKTEKAPAAKAEAAPAKTESSPAKSESRGSKGKR